MVNDGQRTAEALFWGGSLASRPLPSLLAAARAGGFARMAVSPYTLSGALAGGLTAADILEQARAAGVEIFELDGVASWAPAPLPAGAPASLRARFDFSPRHCLDLASALGMRRVVVVGVFEPGALTTEELVSALRTFCDAAARREITVELEFVPYWGITHLADAWQILAAAEQPNISLLIDSWHLLMGTHDLEADLRLLAEIPTGRITGLQLADARRAAPGTDIASLGRERRFPGNGELPIGELLQVIAHRHPAVDVGTEIFGHHIDELSDEDAGRACGQTTRAALRNLAQLGSQTPVRDR